MPPILVQRMTLAPNRCMICGTGNIENVDHTIGPFIDLQIDYNYGDSAYLCMRCGELIAALTGWHTPEDLQSKEAELDKKNREIHDLRAKLEIIGRQKQAAVNQLQHIRDGSRELKNVRKTKAKAAS